MVSWYCKIADLEIGPMSQEKLVKMAHEGRLSPDDLVRNAKKKKWYKAKSVKGLTFKGQEPKVPETETTAPESIAHPDTSTKATGSSADSGTSATATRLLKAIRKKKDTGDEKGPTPVSIKQRREEWRPPPSKLDKPLKRKPLDPTAKIILTITTTIVVVLMLFPPHKVPRGYVSEGKAASATGRLTQFVFTPPEMKLEMGMRGVGNVDLKEFTMDEDGKAYVMARLPINWMRLALEWLGVIVVGAGACGFVMVRTTVAEVPEVQATPPQQRPQRV